MKLGIDDPEAWFETLPAEVWAVWQAYFYAEPEQFGFTKTERENVVDQVHNAMAKLGVETEFNRGVVWPPR